MEDSAMLEDDPEMVRVALAMFDALDEDDDCLPTLAEPLSPLLSLPSDGALSGDVNDGATHVERPDTNQHQEVNAIDCMAPQAPRGYTQPTDDSVLGSTGKTRKRTTREREREEAAYLRDKMKELEATLATLKTEARKQRTETAGQPPTAVDRVWERLTARQLRERHHAELENAKLRAKLRSQLKIGKSLMRLFRRASHESENIQHVGSPQKAHPDFIPLLPFSTNPNDHIELEVVLAKLDIVYHRLESMFTAKPFSNGELDFRDVQLHCDTLEHEIGMDFMDGWALPFPVRDALGGVWRAALKKVPSDDCILDVFENLKAPANTAIARYQGIAVTKEPLFRGTIKGTIIMKHFYDPAADQGVLVSVWNGTVVNDERKLFMSEESVTRIEKVPMDGGGGQSDAITRVQTCHRLRLQAATGASIPRRQVGLMTDLLMVEVERYMIERQHMIEDVLLRTRGVVQIIE